MKQSTSSLNRGNKVTATLKKLWKNQYFQTAVVIGLIVVVIFGFWFGLQVAFNTKIPPMLAVISGSMCIPYDGACDGWTHPFDRTLHIGDLIVIQGVDPATLNTNYPDSDIIVFHQPDDPNTLIVHRIVLKIEDADGKLSFYTKGDGNPPVQWPAATNGYDYWGPVSQDAIVGKVVMRIPWVGHIAMVTQDYSLVPIIVIIVVLIVIVEFVFPLIKNMKTQTKEKSISMEQQKTDTPFNSSSLPNLFLR
jgi:signal peptidase I